MFWPIRGHSRTSRRRTSLASYDCVRLILVRDGSVVLRIDDTEHPATVGDTVLVGPGTPFGYDPEETSTITTLMIDTDYLIEHLFWQHLDLIPDRDAARDLAARLYPEPVQMLRVGEQEVEQLGPILDELVTLTGEGQSPGGYFRAHALLFTVLDAIAPHIRSEPVEIPPLTSRQRAVRIAPPRWHKFRPVRREIARTAALMQSDIARRWPLSELAEHACLSSSQFNRVFKDSFGVTPLTYLSILRVQEMARLIRETTLLIGTITEQVGWCHHCGQATRLFRRYMGVTPIDYRRYGPPSATQGGPGTGVARAA